jgi:hypothetical protein
MTSGIPSFEVIDDEMAKVWRAKTGEERLRIANRMFVFARRTLVTVVRNEHPDWDDSRVNQEACRRLLRGSV